MITIFTEHPAPYWFKVQENLSYLEETNCVYIKENVKSKPWDLGIDREYRTSWYEKFVYLLRSRILIIGGLYLWQFLVLIVLAIILNKKFYIFSDVPEAKYRSKLNIYFKKLIFRSAQGLLIAGNLGKERYREIYEVPQKKLFYLPYGWNEEECNTIVTKGTSYRFIVVNRFLPRKGYEILFNALNQIKSQNSDALKNVHLDVVGDGPLLDHFTEKFNKKLFGSLSIEFHGWIEYQEYLKLLCNSDVLLHTSIFEPFGIPVCEALARGKFVIASNGVMSALDFIKNGVNGLIYDSDDTDQLASCIREYLKNRAKGIVLDSPRPKKYSSFIREFWNYTWNDK